MSTNPCDRTCLQALVDDYLAAMVAHDPTRLPLADGYKYTENTARIPIGDGLWVGAAGGPTVFKIYALDPVAGQAGFFGVMHEIDRPVLLALRLKIVDRQICETAPRPRPTSRPTRPILARPRANRTGWPWPALTPWASAIKCTAAS